MTLFQIKAILGIGLVVAVLFIGWRVHNHIDTGGYNRCQAEHKAAVQKAKDQARSQIVKVEKKYAPKIKEIHNAPDSGYGVGPITARAIDGL